MSESELEKLAQAAWEQSSVCKETSGSKLGYQELWKNGWKNGVRAVLEGDVEMPRERLPNR